MYTLYMRPGCPFCEKVLSVIDQQSGIQVTRKDIRDSVVAEELVAHGGKRQVPYLVDEQNGVSLYETTDIISYLISQTSEASDENV